MRFIDQLFDIINNNLKQDHRMSRNYLLDIEGDKVNTLLATAGFNFREMLQRLKAEALELFLFFWRMLLPGIKIEYNCSF
jgi:hypothetical protein